MLENVDISEVDALAEGVTLVKEDAGCPISAFRRLWNQIYGPGAWDDNPWVVALTFTVGHHNIDEVHS